MGTSYEKIINFRNFGIYKNKNKNLTKEKFGKTLVNY